MGTRDRDVRPGTTILFSVIFKNLGEVDLTPYSTGSSFPTPVGDPRPTAYCFPQDARWTFDWNGDAHLATDGLAGTACYNAPVTPNDFCTDTAEVKCPN